MSEPVFVRDLDPTTDNFDRVPLGRLESGSQKSTCSSTAKQFWPKALMQQQIDVEGTNPFFSSVA